ncbi:MAG: NlpC/P60 family protein [Pseudomonadota bacterium]
MMRRRIFMWMGLVVLFFALGAGREVFAADSYKVKRGDNLAKISKKFGVSVEALKETNNLQSDALKPRQALLIPKSTKTKVAKSKKSTHAVTTSYIVKKGDSLYTIARKTGVSVSDLREMNHIRGSRLRLGQRLFLAKSESRVEVAEAAADNVEPTELSALPEGDELEEDDAGPANADEWASTDQEADREKEESAEILGKWESPHERQLFARVAMGFLGAPYRFGGSSVRGLDCSAFVKKIYAFFNISLPRTAREQARIGKRISRSDLEVGDLVFFNTRRRAFGHVGIYIGNNEFVHASAGRTRAVKVDTLDKPYYNKRFVKAVRLKALDEDA